MLPLDQPSQNSFYRARLRAFLAFLVTPYLFSIAIAPAFPLIKAMDAAGKAHVTELFYFGYSVVAVGWALWIIKSAIEKELRFDPDMSEKLTAAFVKTLRSKLLLQSDVLKTLRSKLLLQSERPVEDIVVGVCSYLMILPIVILAVAASNNIFKAYPLPQHPIGEQIKDLTSGLDRTLIFFQAAVFAPILEEILFRGVLFGALKDRYGLAVGVALSGLIFAGVHPTLPHMLFPLWILGSTLAYIAHRRQSLLPTIVAHSCYNGVFILFGFMAGTT